MTRIGITGTGSCIPEVKIENNHFLEHSFLNPDGSQFKQNNTVIIKKFQAITGIAERRYAQKNQNNSDLAYKRFFKSYRRRQN